MTSKQKWFLIILMIASTLLLTHKSVRTYWKKKQYLKELETQLTELQDGNKSLTLQIERIKVDPRITEQHARRELGLIQPGEIEYRFMREISGKESSNKNKNESN